MGIRDEDSSRNNSSQHSGCSHGHHCYHTIPGQYGGSRSDTYDRTECCNCNKSEPNPYENERR